MKRWILSFVAIAMLLSFAACSSEKEAEKSLVEGQYYLGEAYTRSQNASSQIILFFDDDSTFQVVDAGFASKKEARISYYGSYTCEGKALTLKISTEEYTGVVLEDGKELQIGSDVFTITALDRLSDETRAAFE